MSEMNYQDRRVFWVWISMVLGAANENVWKLCRGFKSVSDFADAVKECRFSDMTDAQCSRAKTRKYEDAQRVIERCENENVSVITIRDKDYPVRLKRTPNPPAVLFARGDIKRLNTAHTVSVVGTRTPCEYSVRAVKALCEDFSKLGIPVLTGAEEGIDLAANDALCENEAVSAAILGRGIFDQRTGEELFGKIAEYGVVLSEYTDSNDFGRVAFDARNRILCGLSDAVLFIEAGAGSRGLNNVKHAERLNRPVFCVPPSDITDKRFFGQRNLIRNGAYSAFDASDIVRVLENDVKNGHNGVKYDEIRLKKEQESDSERKMSVKKVKKVSENLSEGLQNSENSVKIDTSGFSESQKKIYDLLSEKGTMHINQISELLSIPVNEVVNDITMLNFAGAIEEFPGKQYGAK